MTLRPGTRSNSRPFAVTKVAPRRRGVTLFGHGHRRLFATFGHESLVAQRVDRFPGHAAGVWPDRLQNEFLADFVDPHFLARKPELFR